MSFVHGMEGAASLVTANDLEVIVILLFLVLTSLSVLASGLSVIASTNDLKTILIDLLLGNGLSLSSGET